MYIYKSEFAFICHVYSLQAQSFLNFTKSGPTQKAYFNNSIGKIFTYFIIHFFCYSYICNLYELFTEQKSLLFLLYSGYGIQENLSQKIHVCRMKNKRKRVKTMDGLLFKMFCSIYICFDIYRITCFKYFVINPGFKYFHKPYKMSCLQKLLCRLFSLNRLNKRFKLLC